MTHQDFSGPTGFQEHSQAGQVKEEKKGKEGGENKLQNPGLQGNFIGLKSPPR